MKYCKNCGAQLADDDDYCYFCGKPLEEEEKKEPPVFQDHSYYEDKTMYNRETTNIPATLGLVFSFISPIVGLIISIIGLNRSRRLNGLGRGQAIAGIIISIVSMIVSIAIYMIYFNMYGEELI